MKIAIVHDFLKEYGGAERVLEVLHEMYPAAPIYTAFLDRKGLGPHSDQLKTWDIRTSWAQKIPFISRLYSPLRFLAPLFFESFDFTDYDLVISSTNAYYAKGILTQPETTHLCYCHTPPRFLYGYQTRVDWKKNFFTRAYGYLIGFYLRRYDYLSAQRVDYFIANSNVVKQRIKKFYRRDSTVIYPPVGFDNKSKIKSSASSGKKPDSADKQNCNYYLCVGKLATAKNVDIVVEAALKTGFKLKVVGKGSSSSVVPRSEATRNLLQKQGLTETSSEIPHFVRNDNGGEVEFLGEVGDEELIEMYQNCKAVIFAAVDEDFGIVPVEAMSFGKPVIALRSGGVVETVVDGKTGVFFEEETPESLIKAIRKFEQSGIKASDCIGQAMKFSKEAFIKKIKEFVDEHNNIDRKGIVV